MTEQSVSAPAIHIYCVKCKTKTESRDVAETTMRNGRPAVTALCAVCDTKKFRIGKLEAVAAAS